MRAAKCQTREISWIDELFTVFQRSRAIQVVREAAGARGSTDARELTVVDAGCFDGRLYWYMEQSHLYPHYVGMDAREDYVAEARRKIPNGRSLLVHADLTGSDIPGHGVGDVVVCLEVLEHLEADAAPVALQNLFYLAKPGGLVIVGTPVNTRARIFHRLESEQNLGHVNFLVHENLLEFVAGLGHQLIEASPGWSLKSAYRIPHQLPEPWATMRDRLGPAFRAAYLSCMTEPNGGGFYVWRKASQIEEGA